MQFETIQTLFITVILALKPTYPIIEKANSTGPKNITSHQFHEYEVKILGSACRSVL